VVKRNDITLLLHRMDEGQPGALDELMGIVYSDLERMAAAHLRRQFGARAGQITLEPAALVNESFLQLIKQRKGFDNRGQFFAIATKLMLRVLSDYRRGKQADKRGGGRSGARVTLSLDPALTPDRTERGGREDAVEVDALAAALQKLEGLDPMRADIIKMRVVWGLTVPEIAEALGVSPSSVDRDWRWAKCWLAEELGLTGT